MIKAVFSILILLMLGASASARVTINVPLDVAERLSVDEMSELQSFTYSEWAQFQENYANFEEALQGKEGKIRGAIRTVIPLGVRTAVAEGASGATGWLEDRGLIDNFIEDLKLSYFRHPRAFLNNEVSKGIFAQVGFYLAGGLPKRGMGGKYYSLGMSIMRTSGAGYKFKFYVENLSLNKVFTPVFEASTFLNVGYEKIGEVEVPHGEAKIISRVHAPASIVTGLSSRGSEVGLNLSPFSFPPVVSSFTGSKFEGNRTVFLSFEMGTAFLNLFPFLRRRALSQTSCRAFI